MKIQIKTDLLQKRLPFLLKAISPKSQIPVLLHLLFEAKEQTVQLSATDLEIGMHITLPATVSEEGAVTIPAKLFADLIASLPQEDITIQTTEKGLAVTSSKTKTVFQVGEKEDFPKLFEEKGSEVFALATEKLHSYFSSIVFATSVDVVKPSLTGVLIKREDGNTYVLVATDGYRLSLRKRSFDGEMNQDTSIMDTGIIVPGKILKELLSLKDQGKEMKVYIAKKNNQILFYDEEVLLVGRLIEATFPNYEKIIPSDFETRAFFDRESLQKAVKICSIFARETANIVKLSLRKEKIIVSANTPSVGENTVEVEARLTGEENEIAFNARYLFDFLTTIDQDNLLLEMTGPLNPGVFKIENDESFLHIIMPIRVQA